MRAIDKGGSPYKEIDEYQDAIPYLEKKIGLYCSYCEMSIKHVWMYRKNDIKEVK